MLSHTRNDATVPYDINTLVWVKQPDYPWWPGIVIDPSNAGLGPMPADSALCVMCYPTEAATAVFVQDARDKNEIRRFRGLRHIRKADNAETESGTDSDDDHRNSAGDDAKLVQTGMSNAQCAPAVREALAVFAERHTSSASHHRPTHAVHILETDVDTHMNTAANNNTIDTIADNNNQADSHSDSAHNGVDTVNPDRAVAFDRQDSDTQEADLTELTALIEQPQKHPSSRRARHEHRRHERRHRRAQTKRRHHHDAGRASESDSGDEHDKHANSPGEHEDSEGDTRDRNESSHHRSKYPKHRRRQRDHTGNEDTRHLRQTQLEEYGTSHTRNTRSESSSRNESNNDNDASTTDKHLSSDTHSKFGNTTEQTSQYLYQCCRAARHSVSDGTLAQSGARLLQAIAECLHTGYYDEHEDALLALLRPLACCDVTLAQLRRTHIGLTVGQLVKGVFPHRVRALAQAILTYWFTHLPAAIRRGLIAETEVDRCSVVSMQSGSSHRDGAPALLGTVGVHLFNSFTEEEINDAPLSVDVTELCRAIEVALRDCSENHDTQVMVLSELTDPANSALRRAILQGKLTPVDVVRETGQMRSLRRRRPSQGALLPRIVTSFDASASMDSPTSPFSPASPVSDSSSFTSPTSYSMLGNVTTLYACPNCGAQEAYRTNYTVQAHDNFPEIFQCTKCHTSWNITGQ